MVDGLLMAHRTRHLCRVSEMPHPYLIGFSPYGNSSYLVPSVVGSLDRYTLYRSLQKSMRSQPLEPGEGLSGLECRLYPWVWNTGGSRACDHPNMEFVVIRHQ